MEKLRLFSNCCLIILLCSCSNNKKPTEQITDKPVEVSGEITISGAFALYPLVQSWADEFMKINPDVTIKIDKTNTGAGLSGINSGSAQLAMVSRDFSMEESQSDYWRIGVARGGVVAVCNSENPVIDQIMEKGITPKQFLDLYSSDKNLSWGDLFNTDSKEPVEVYCLSDESGTAEVWASFLYMAEADFKGEKLEGDENMVSKIKENNNAIGFCSLNFIYDLESGKLLQNISIIPIDMNGNGIIDKKEELKEDICGFLKNMWLGLYPSHLCRPLYLVMKEKPTDPAMIEFLKYVLSEGQNKVGDLGYCKLYTSDIECKLNMLKQL
jgi:phosphate transport system substrate-binding protein